MESIPAHSRNFKIRFFGRRTKSDEMVEHLAREFPDCIDSIRARCANDPVFEEICSDFEEIASELATAASRGVSPLPSITADLAHTLLPLRYEILQILNQARSENNNPRYLRRSEQPI